LGEIMQMVMMLQMNMELTKLKTMMQQKVEMFRQIKQNLGVIMQQEVEVLREMS
jgi:hypothetical protein